MLNDLENKTVLITGATRGVGLAIAKAFSREGCRCIITHAWGSVNEGEILKEFQESGYKEPLIIQSDVSNADDIDVLIKKIHEMHDSIYAYIANAAFALLTPDLTTYSERALFRSITYTSWPLVSYLKQIKAEFNSFPQYVIGLSSNGPIQYHVNYDLVAMSKCVLETIVKYLSYHLINEKINLNILRARFVETDSLRASCGDDFIPFGHKYNTHGLFIPSEEVANACIALCSGLMDGINSEIITVDGGSTFADNIMRFYEKRTEFKM